MAKSPVSTITLELPENLAQALVAYARQHDQSPESVVTAALATLLGDDEDGRVDFSAASQAALARIWDNDQDAIYDNWKELYGVTTG